MSAIQALFRAELTTALERLLRGSDYYILMNVLKQGEHLPYVIIRHNFHTPEQFSVVEIVKGLSRAQFAVDRWARELTNEEKEAGWSYHLERTTLSLGSDPEDATEIMRSERHSRRSNK